MLRKKIPYADPYITEEDVKAVADAVRNKRLSQGEYVARFEQEFAGHLNREQAIATTNGTAALHLAVLAAGVKPGDEVIIPSFTFAATANCVLYVGAKPVFVDIDPNTFNVDPECVDKAITPKTKAIIVVHYGGQIADMDPIMESAEIEIVYDTGLKIILGKLLSNGSFTYSPKVPVNLVIDQWYLFEVWYKSDPIDGEYRLWLDGNELISVTGLNSVPPENITLPNGFDLGLSHRDDKPSNYTASVDCVVAADYRVGMENGSLPPTVPVTIQTLDNRTGASISNALVKLGIYQANTNSSGFAAFAELPRSSNYEVNVTKAGYYNQSQVIRVSQTALDLKMYLEPVPVEVPEKVEPTPAPEAPQKVSITIVASDTETQAPIPGALVQFGSLQGYTDSSGSIMFSDIDVGLAYDLIITKSGYITITTQVDVSDTSQTLKYYLNPLKAEASPTPQPTLIPQPPIRQPEHPVILMTPLIVGAAVLVGFMRLSKFIKTHRKSNLPTK